MWVGARSQAYRLPPRYYELVPQKRVNPGPMQKASSCRKIKTDGEAAARRAGAAARIRIEEGAAGGHTGETVMKFKNRLTAGVMLLLALMCQSPARAFTPGLNGTPGTARATGPAPAIQAPCNADFYGVELGTFPACHDYWTKKNLFPVTLSQYETGGRIYLAGSFQAGLKRRARWGMSQAQFEQINDTYLTSGEGWRVDQVSVLTTEQGQFFAAIWVEDLQHAWKSHNAMLQDAFDKRFIVLNNEGWSMVDLASYRVRTLLAGAPYQAVRWSGTWLGLGAGGAVVYDGMTLDKFLSRDGKLSQEGYGVTRFITYRGDSRQGGPLLHAAIWRKSATPRRMLPDMKPADYQKAYNTNTAQGYRLYYVNAFEDSVSAIWIKPAPPIKVPGK